MILIFIGILSIGTVEINEGTIKTTANSATTCGIVGTNIILNGGTISAESAASYGIMSAGNVKINGGEINTTKTNSYGIYYQGENTVTINGGIINSSYYGIYNNSSGTINLNGGKINTTNEKGYAYGIYNGSGGTINMTEGEISTIAFYGRGINNAGGTIDISGGEIIASSNITGATCYGVYNSGSGTITIGKNDENVSTETPVIRSNSNYGIYNNGSGAIKFYDGAILGKTEALYGNIKEENIPEGYKINPEIITIDLTNVLQRYTLIIDETATP